MNICKYVLYIMRICISPILKVTWNFSSELLITKRKILRKTEIDKYVSCHDITLISVPDIQDH